VLHPPRPRERGLRARFAVLSIAVWMTAALVTASALLSAQLSASGRRMFGVAILAAILTPIFVTCEWGACGGGGGDGDQAASGGAPETTAAPAGGGKQYEVLPDDELSDTDASPKEEDEDEEEEEEEEGGATLSVYAQQLQPLRGKGGREVAEGGNGNAHRNTDGGDDGGGGGGEDDAMILRLPDLPELSTTEVVRTAECWLLGFGAVCLWCDTSLVLQPECFQPCPEPVLANRCCAEHV
jgi:hypothetical protein